MSWIREIAHAAAEGDLKEAYDRMVRERAGRLPRIFTVMSLHPAGMRAVEAVNRAVTFGASTLGRRREELIATHVSRLNGCEY